MKIKQVAASGLVKVEKLARVSQSGPDKERIHGQFRLCVHPVSTSEAASEARLYKKTHENVEFHTCTSAVLSLGRREIMTTCR